MMEKFLMGFFSALGFNIIMVLFIKIKGHNNKIIEQIIGILLFIFLFGGLGVWFAYQL